MMKVALFDTGGVYLGQREIADADFDPAVHVDAAEYGGDCDIRVGKGLPSYRWNAEKKCFEPMNTRQEELARAFQKIIEFAARESAGVSARPLDKEEHGEIDALIKEHFPIEHRKVRQ